MRRSWWIIPIVSLAGMCSIGCENKVQEQRDQLYLQVQELQSDNSKLKQELGQRLDPAAAQQMQQQIAQQNAQISDLQNQLRTAPPGQSASSGLAGIEVTRNDAEGTVTVNLPGDILFDSGKADIKSSAKATLNKVVEEVKKRFPGKRVLVRGHTDSDPIVRSKDLWKDNLDLSAARARTVAEYLGEQGLDPKLIKPQGWGDSTPRATKPGSRRVEIVVMTR